MAQYKESSSTFIALTVVMGSASILAVLLRIVARRRSKSHLGLDDAFAVAALCGFLTFQGFILWGKLSPEIIQHPLTRRLASYNGLNYGLADLPPNVLENDLKVCRLLGLR